MGIKRIRVWLQSGGRTTVSILLLLFVSISCSQPTPRPSSTFLAPTQIPPSATPPQASATQTIRITETAAIPRTATSTPPQRLNLESLKPGDYIVYSADDDEIREDGYVQSSLFLVSLDNVFQGRLWPDIGGSARISPDSKFIAYSTFKDLRIHDLSTGIELDPPECIGLNLPVAWSPDGTQLALSCDDNGYGIYILTLANETLSPLIPSSYLPAPEEVTPDLGGIYTNLVWSPDGRRLAYYDSYLYYRSGPPRLFDGPYVTELNCLEDISTCQAKTDLISNILDGPLAWSRDSQFLSIAPWQDNEGNGASGVHTFDLKTGEEVKILAGEYKIDSSSNLMWSPDGHWLAFSIGTKDIVLVSQMETRRQF